MRRSEVWRVNHPRNSEEDTGASQLAVIVSNDAANQRADRVQVVPLSRKIDNHFHCQSPVMVEGKEWKARADQIMTVNKERLTERQGVLSQEEMYSVDLALRLQLGLAA